MTNFVNCIKVSVYKSSLALTINGYAFSAFAFDKFTPDQIIRLGEQIKTAGNFLKDKSCSEYWHFQRAHENARFATISATEKELLEQGNNRFNPEYPSWYITDGLKSQVLDYIKKGDQDLDEKENYSEKHIVALNQFDLI